MRKGTRLMPKIRSDVVPRLTLCCTRSTRVARTGPTASLVRGKGGVEKNVKYYPQSDISLFDNKECEAL